MPKPGESRSKMVTYNGKQYVSMTACMKDYGLSTSNFQSWKNNPAHKHLSAQEAVEMYINMKLNSQMVHATSQQFRLDKVYSHRDALNEAQERQRRLLETLFRFRSRSRLGKESEKPIKTIIECHLDPYEIIYLIHITGCTLTEAITCALTDSNQGNVNI